MNYGTRLQRFQVNAQTQKFVTVVGHGTLISPLNTSFNTYNATYFKVPDGVSVVFISRPGYFVALRSLKEDNMMSLLHSDSKLRKFIAGTLPASETPGIVRRAAWNWKNHIYTPGMMCPNMGFEFYDKTGSSWGRWYDSQSGVWYPGTNRSPEYKGRRGTLKNLISSVHTKGIFMVFGCRGDPAEYARLKQAFEHSGKLGNQNYPIPMSNLTRNVQASENKASKYLLNEKKRVRVNNLTLRKKNTNSPKTKRPRTTTLPPLSFHPGRTPTTKRPGTLRRRA